MNIRYKSIKLLLENDEVSIGVICEVALFENVPKFIGYYQKEKDFFYESEKEKSPA